MPKKTENNDIDTSPASFVVRIANVLVCLSKGISKVTEIAKYCNLSNSTTHRLLNILTEPHLVFYDSVKHRYYLGALFFQIASTSKASHQYLIMNAIGEMMHLSDISGETILLDLLIGMQHIKLHSIGSKHALKVEEDEQWITLVLPYGATQKALLSQFKDEELELTLRNLAERSEIQQKTVDIESMMAQLKQIGQQGYAVSYGENIPETVCIAAVVENYICPVSLSILGPQSRLAQRVPEITKVLLVSARRLSKNIYNVFQNY